MNLNIRLITPEKVVLNSPAEETIVPSLTGQLGILPNHAPIVSALDIGVLRIRYNEKWTVIILFGGFLEVRNNEVIIVANEIEETSTVQKEQVKMKLAQAFENLGAANNQKERILASEELKKASARVQASFYL